MSCQIARAGRARGVRAVAASIMLGLLAAGCSGMSGSDLSMNGLLSPKPMPKGGPPAEQPTELSSPGGGTMMVQKSPQVPSFDNDLTAAAGLSAPAAKPTVNTYLWRAALDTISFMPLVSADSTGGVIITDWYSPPETPKERFKLNVIITGQDLKADSLKVTVFHQSQTDGQWQEATSDKATSTELEDSILTRAQRLRTQTIGQ